MSLSIADRFADIERHEFYSLSTLLDPCFKDKVFSSHAAVVHSRKQLLVVTDLSVKNNLFLKITPLTPQQLLIKTTTIYTHMENKQ